MKDKNQKLYNCDSYFQTDEFKNKRKIAESQRTQEEINNIRIKREQTNLSKYGQKYAILTEESRIKAKESMQLDSIKEKRKATNLKKYGSTTPIANSIIQKKMNDAKLERYGYINKSYDISKEYLEEEYINKKLMLFIWLMILYMKIITLI
jgi:hypothetical protein